MRVIEAKRKAMLAFVADHRKRVRDDKAAERRVADSWHLYDRAMDLYDEQVELSLDPDASDSWRPRESLYRRSAALGLAEAQYELGVHLDVGARQGEGTAADLAEAVDWYRLGAAQGHIASQHNLAVMIQAGTGTDASESKAHEWYLRAADHGHLPSQFNLALQYQEGKGVQQSHVKAVEWLRKAADQGMPEAQNTLAIATLHGRGMPANPLAAMTLFKESAAGGNEGAKATLARGELTKAQMRRKVGISDEMDVAKADKAARLALKEADKKGFHHVDREPARSHQARAHLRLLRQDRARGQRRLGQAALLQPVPAHQVLQRGLPPSRRARAQGGVRGRGGSAKGAKGKGKGVSDCVFVGEGERHEGLIAMWQWQ